MSLAKLPNDLILLIVDCLKVPKNSSPVLQSEKERRLHLNAQSDLNSLIQVNRRLYSLLPLLYRYSFEHCRDRSFSRAAAFGCLAAVKQFVAEGFDVRYTPADYRCTAETLNREKWEPWEDGHPILLASRYGHVEVVEYLLEQGADPCFRNTCRQTPLRLAAKNGCLAVVKLLLNQPAVRHDSYSIPHPTDWETWRMQESPIQQAVSTKQKDVVDYLLKLPQCTTYHTRFLASACLPEAAATGDISMVSLLLAYGANVNFESPSQYTPIVSLRFWELDRCPNALISAVRHGHLQMVQFLIDRGAKISHVPRNGYVGGSALSVAVTHGHEDIVKELLRYDVFELGDGTLHEAVFGGRPRIAKLLLNELDHNPRFATQLQGQNLLAYAASRGDLQAFELCLGHGFDEQEALVAAIQSNNATIAGMLLDRRPSPSLPPLILDTAVDAAFFNSDISTIEKLLASGRQIHPATVRFCRQHRSQEIVTLAERFTVHPAD
ncbi:ankyrin repeat-containing domain protein [Aspergillus similis]